MMSVSDSSSVIEIDCRHLRQRLSDYLDGDFTPDLRRTISTHLAGCKDCSAVYDGMSNVVALLADDRSFQLPEGFGERLFQRLSLKK